MRLGLPELHQDLLVEVLVWLPVETLIKFRCASKTWRVLIDSTHFRQLHLRRIRSWTSTEEQNKFLFGLQPSSTMKKRDLYYLAEFDSRHKRIQKTILELRSPFKRDGDWRLDIYGSCNGLVCLGYQDREKYEEEEHKSTVVFLCNPYINKYWELPFYPIPGSHLPHCWIDFYGFGYDELAHDFKVVRWVQLFSIHVDDEEDEAEYEDPFPIGEQVMVYSLKSNAWTNLDVQLFHLSKSNQAVADHNGILVNHALHWMIQDIAARNVAILGLDIRTYKCHRVPLPPEIEGDKLLALDGCLCVIDWVVSGGLVSVLEMWIMRDYGVQDSWTEVIIELSSLNTQLPSLGLTTMGELFPVAYSQRSSTELFCYGDNGVTWYDAEKNDWVLAPLVGPYSNGYISNGFKFVSSLIEHFPCGSSSLVENTGGIKRVEANLLRIQNCRLPHSGSSCCCER